MSGKMYEKRPEEDARYHDTWRLLKKYRDVTWSLELSIRQVKNQFRIDYDCSIEDFLESIYMAGADLGGTDIENHARCIERSYKMLTLLENSVNLLRTHHQSGEVYAWILSSELPSLDFASFTSVLLTIIGVCANGGVALIVLILTLILAWNYIKLLFEAAERYVLLGVLVYTAPVAFAMGASQSTANIFKSWCRMFGGQIFLLLMNAWCLRLFITMVGTFISNPLSM